MKTYCLTILFILIVSLPLLAQSNGLAATFSPSTVMVNSFNTASFDPTSPQSQPILTTLTIQNNTDQSFIFLMKLDVKWNGVALTNATFRSKEPIPANGIFYPLSNRDLITTTASTYFNSLGLGGISLQDVIENNPVLRRAVLAGFFPDGTVTLEIQVKPDNPEASYTTPAVFSIVVRNAGTINLVSPGVPIGEMPPVIDSNPVSFFWNSIATDFNEYYLNIREFGPQNPPTADNVETMGQHFWPQTSTTVSGGSYVGFIPFVPGNYYAWQISTQLYTETSPRLRTDNNPRLKSNWFVFRYSPQNQSPPITINELQVALSSLGNPDMDALFNGGFVPFGVVQVDGISYTGEEAINLVRSLLGRNVMVEIRN